MSTTDRTNIKRVNFYDGHRITERDLDTEQIHNNSLVSTLVSDFMGSGIIRANPFKDRILLDTRNPAISNPSAVDITAGRYDGKGISLDLQPSDPIYGNRIEFELIGTQAMGRDKPKVMILGRAFDGSSDTGFLVAEFIEFFTNEKRISSYYYIEIISILFNNFSGGAGRTDYSVDEVESLDLIGDSGYLIIREAKDLSVYPSVRTSFQIESPNYDMKNFITSDTSNTIEEEIESALGPSNSISDLYIEMDGITEPLSFEAGAATSIVYGQKILSSVDNIQRVDLLLKGPADGNFSGSLVLSINELTSEISNPSATVPDDLIDYDPEVTPLVEISYTKVDLENLGYRLNEKFQIISFDFSKTLIADPGIEPSIKKGKYYAILLSRRGDNATGTVTVALGYDKVFKKSDDGIPLTVQEQLGKQQSKFTEYDPIERMFVNDSEKSLWFQVYSDAIEITNGTVYTDSGIAVTLTKYREYIGSTKISNFYRNICLKSINYTVGDESSNYLVLSQKEEFSDPEVHPRTNNFVFTRISDVPAVSILNNTEFTELTQDTIPLIISKIKDKNVRSAQDIDGEVSKPGLYGVDYLDIINPTSNILSSNLINRTFTPDLGCSCDKKYRIVKTECSVKKLGDLNSDGKLTQDDISLFIPLLGETINSESTVRKILNQEVGIIDFIKSDLNGDDTIDGIDIELMEDAVNGNVNFEEPEEFTVLRLYFENILEESNNPEILAGLASFVGSTSQITFLTTTEEKALIIRSGDKIIVTGSSNLQDGTYFITSKSIDSTNPLSVTVTVVDEGLEELEFIAESVTISIISGTEVNLYADNNGLASIPFQSVNFKISFVSPRHQDSFFEICDLRRYVNSTFIEEQESSCQCVETTCETTEDCTPIYKNQTYISGDIYMPNGNILQSPGVPHPGDYEYSNIKLPIPPGSISGCSINIYEAFVKSEAGSCYTAAGYPAMKYSDGTLVGCQDDGLDTDITKGRVKFSTAIASICVDALVDGYIIDDTFTGSLGDELPLTTSSSISQVSEVISENFIKYYTDDFSSWDEDLDSGISVTDYSPLILNMETLAGGFQDGYLSLPSSEFLVSGDFILDFDAKRSNWYSGSFNGLIETYVKIDLGSGDEVRVGWRLSSSYTNPKTKLFYDLYKSGAVVYSHIQEKQDDLGDLVKFRVRRINDTIYAYYILPDALTESTEDTFGHYVRIGGNPDEQPGTADATISFGIKNDGFDQDAETFIVRFLNIDIKKEYSSSLVSVDTVTDPDSFDVPQTISLNSTTGEADRLTVTVPFELPRRTTINTAKLLMSFDNITASGNYKIRATPLALINADNLGAVFNVPLEMDSSYQVVEEYNSTVSGTYEINILEVYKVMNLNVAQLPGFLRGFVIEPDESGVDFDLEVGSVYLEVEYVDNTTGIVFQVGVDLNHGTGIVTFDTKNIVFNYNNPAYRTVLNFGVYLKKSGFKNQDVELTVSELSKFGIGTCKDEGSVPVDQQCYFVTGSTGVGNFIEGPFPCPV